MAISNRRWLRRALVPSAAVALAAGLLATPGAAVVTQQSGAGLSTNYDFARLVLLDGGWPSSVNNVTSVVQWLRAEEPSSDWWNRDNPLNDGLGSGGGSGLGAYRSVVVAAVDVARNLQNAAYGYPRIVHDLAISAPPIVTARSIWRSSWAAGHYGFGADWGTTTVPSVAAPPTAWQSPTACPIRYPAGVVGPCGAGFTASGATWRTGAPGGIERQELWTFSTAGVPDAATWAPRLAAGSYEVDVFVPAGFSDAVVAYTVTDALGRHRVLLDQEPYANVWVPLGDFEAGAAGIRVVLSSRSVVPSVATFVAADAVRFSRTSTRAHAVGPTVRPSTALVVRAPGRPQDVTAVAGDAVATVSWLAPSKDGGAPVRTYTVTAEPGGRSCRAGVPATGEAACVVHGLVDGTGYQFVVAAQNRLGIGARSVASSPARPIRPATLALSVPTAALRLSNRVVVRALVTPPHAAGSVLFSLDGHVLTSCAAARVVRGRAACALRLTAAGRHVVLATYSGTAAQSGTQHAIALLVARARTSLLAGVSPTAVATGGVVLLHAWHLPGHATGRIVFRAGAVTLCAAQARDGAGRCTARVALPIGVHVIQAAYAGSRDYLASSARTSMRVLPAPVGPSLSGRATARTPRRS